jgi:ribosome recycling factor
MRALASCCISFNILLFSFKGGQWYQKVCHLKYIPLPPLTEERRRELVRIVKDEAEQAKVAAGSLDDIANQTAKSLSQTAGLLVDDTAAIPQYVSNTAAKIHWAKIGFF